MYEIQLVDMKSKLISDNLLDSSAAKFGIRSDDVSSDAASSVSNEQTFESIFAKHAALFSKNPSSEASNADVKLEDESVESESDVTLLQELSIETTVQRDAEILEEVYKQVDESSITGSSMEEGHSKEVAVGFTQKSVISDDFVRVPIVFSALSEHTDAETDQLMEKSSVDSNADITACITRIESDESLDQTKAPVQEDDIIQDNDTIQKIPEEKIEDIHRIAFHDGHEFENGINLANSVNLANGVDLVHVDSNSFTYIQANAQYVMGTKNSIKRAANALNADQTRTNISSINIEDVDITGIKIESNTIVDNNIPYDAKANVLGLMNLNVIGDDLNTLSMNDAITANTNNLSNAPFANKPLDPELIGATFKSSVTSDMHQMLNPNQQVSFALRQAVKNQLTTVSVGLHPEHLGSIEIKMTFSAMGKVESISISAEKKDTVNMFVSDVENFKSTVREVVKIDDASLSFDLKQERDEQPHSDGNAQQVLSEMIEEKDVMRVGNAIKPQRSISGLYGSSLSLIA